MQKAASADGINAPTALDGEHKAKVDRLVGSSGETFDSSCLAEQVAAHEEAVALFTGYANDGAAGALKDFAAKTLPTLQKHLEQVKNLPAK
jgi:putative membrane protein